MQWNCRGLISKWAEVKPFLVGSDCQVVCLQETHFLASDEYDFHLYNYSLYNAFSPTATRHGGVCIYVCNNWPHFEVPLNTSLQAVACCVRVGRQRLCFCSLYLPPTAQVSLSALDNLILQLPQPFILCSDVNARHFMWGSDRCDSRGSILERLISNHALNVLNDGCPTRMDEFTGLWSHIDITVSTSDIGQYLHWRTASDLYSSDHCPLYVTYDRRDGTTDPERDTFFGWNFKKANWVEFSNQCNFDDVDMTDMPTSYNTMIDRLLTVARDTVPQKTGPPKYACPWWNDECKEAIRDRKRALNRFRRHRTTSLLLAYKAAKAKARRVIRQAKKQSWESLLHLFNVNTPLSQLWGIIRKFTRKERFRRTLPVLHVRGSVIDDQVQVGNILGQFFSDISSSMHYRPSFLEREKDLTDSLPSFVSSNGEAYNDLFSLTELKEAIAKCGNTSMGPDYIHYSFFRHFTEPQLIQVVNMINCIWCAEQLPQQWKHSVIIPILKPGKPRDNPASYRPIQLTSCFSKLMERMVTERLTWYVEQNNLISAFQCAFRKGRSTADHLVRLDSDVRRGFFCHQYTLAVFLDLQSAYNLISKVAILHRLYSIGLRRRLAFFVKSYLEDRTFQVRNGVLSDTFAQENGLIQGGVISPLLFNIMINDIFSNIPNNVSCALYADDCSMWVSGRRIVSLINQMQTALDCVTEWTDRWGFVFSPPKCHAIIFRRFMKERELAQIPSLTIYNQPLNYSDEVKFLGVIFDSRLNFSKHVQYLKGKAVKRISILKCLAGRRCGADRSVLLRIYKSLVRPILDYSCQILDGPSNRVVDSLDSVQNECIRIATGALRTSPILPLLVEANIPPLRLRRCELTLRFYLKVRSRPDHPCRYLIMPEAALRRVDLNYMKRISGFPLYERLTQMSSETGFALPANVASVDSRLPSWRMHRCDVLKLTDVPKGLLDVIQVQCDFNELRRTYAAHSFIYTDGAKDPIGVGCAYVHGNRCHRYRLPAQSSIFTAEAVAILQALTYVETVSLPRVVLCTDSLSVLMAIDHPPSANPVVAAIIERVHFLLGMNYSITLVWIPGHAGISGNEIADAQAKAAIGLHDVLEMRLGMREYFPAVRASVRDLFGRLWADYNPNTTLKLIKGHVEPWLSSRRSSRREEVVLCRLRLGHTRYTHSYLLDHAPRPMCNDCQCPLSVQHLLVECRTLADERRSLFQMCRERDAQLCLSSLLGDDSPELLDEVMSYLKKCDLLHRL